MYETQQFTLKEAEQLDQLAHHIHLANLKWWMDLEIENKPIKRNFGELIALAHSELSEALEGHRKNLWDDKLPHRKMAEVELADAIIRILDLGKGFGLDVASALVQKCNYNLTREDHTPEHRKTEFGKKY